VDKAFIMVLIKCETYTLQQRSLHELEVKQGKCSLLLKLCKKGSRLKA